MGKNRVKAESKTWHGKVLHCIDAMANPAARGAAEGRIEIACAVCWALLTVAASDPPPDIPPGPPGATSAQGVSKSISRMANPATENRTL